MKMYGKIIATYYEAHIKLKDREDVFVTTTMNYMMDLYEIRSHFGLRRKDVEWYVVYGVDMVRREPVTESEKKLGCGFDELSFLITRSRKAPKDYNR